MVDLKHTMDGVFEKRTTASGIRVGIFGDSFIQGTEGPEEDSLAHLIVKKLEEQGVEIKFLRIHAKDGLTTEEIATDMHLVIPESNPDEKDLEMEEKAKFDLVVVNGGVNDQYRGRSVAAFFDGLNKKLYPTIDKIIAENGQIFKIDTIDWSYSPAGVSGDGYKYRVDQQAGYQVVRDRAQKDAFYNTSQGVSQEVARYNARDKEVAETRDVNFIEVSERTSELVVKDGELDESMFVDHLHFARAVHERQATLVADQIIRVMTEKGLLSLKDEQVDKTILACPIPERSRTMGL